MMRQPASGTDSLRRRRIVFMVAHRVGIEVKYKPLRIFFYINGRDVSCCSVVQRVLTFEHMDAVCYR